MGLKIGNVWKLLKMGKLRGFWCVYYITLLHTMQTSYIYIDIYSFSNQPTSFLMLQRRWIRQWLRHLPCLEIFQLKVYYYHQVVSLNLCHQSLTKGRWEIKYEEFLSALHISYTIISQTLHCMVYLHTICKFTPQLPKCRSVDQPQWASSYAMPTFFNHCNFLVGGKERSTESTSFNSHLLRKLCKNDENFSDIFESLGNTNFLWNKAFFRWYKFFFHDFFCGFWDPGLFPNPSIRMEVSISTWVLTPHKVENVVFFDEAYDQYDPTARTMTVPFGLDQDANQQLSLVEFVEMDDFLEKNLSIDLPGALHTTSLWATKSAEKWISIIKLYRLSHVFPSHSPIHQDNFTCFSLESYWWWDTSTQYHLPTTFDLLWVVMSTFNRIEVLLLSAHLRSMKWETGKPECFAGKK